MRLEPGTILILLCALQSVTAAEPSPDVRILIDVSGSMKKNDPENLRVPALELLIDLLPEGVRAGVWTFGQYVNMQVPLGRVSAAWKARAHEGAREVHSRGLFTNIEEALRRATADWKAPDETRKRSVILLTDGMVDISKDAARNQASRKRILSEVLPELRAVGATVNPIALSEGADHDLMQRLAGATGGWYARADDAEELQRFFLRLFEKAVHRDTLPLDDNRFSVDAGVKELTLLIFHDTQSDPARVIAPGKRILSRQAPGPGARWRGAPGYDLVTVERPAPGRWRIDARIDPDNRAMIVTDLKLMAEDVPASLSPDAALRITAHLEQAGKLIDDARFLGVLSATLAHRIDGSTASEQVARFDEQGTLSIDLPALEIEGMHEFRITVRGGTFEREVRRSVSVQWPAAVESRRAGSEAEPEYAITVTPRAGRMSADSARISAQLASPGGEARSVEFERSGDAGAWQALVTGLGAAPAYALQITITGEGVDGNPIRARLPVLSLAGREAPAAQEAQDAVADSPVPAAAAPQGVEPMPAPPAPRPDWQRVAVVAGAANLLLVIAGVAGWRWWRRRDTVDFDALLEAGGP